MELVDWEAPALPTVTLKCVTKNLDHVPVVCMKMNTTSKTYFLPKCKIIPGCFGVAFGVLVLHKVCGKGKELPAYQTPVCNLKCQNSLELLFHRKKMSLSAIL